MIARAVSFPIMRRPHPDATDAELVDTGTIAVWFWCPGCEKAHAVHVGGDHPGPKWTWNGSLETPTFGPSILVRSTANEPIADPSVPGGQRLVPSVCHSFVIDGRIQFLSDCTHSKAGQTVDLGEPPEWLRK